MLLYSFTVTPFKKKKKWGVEGEGEELAQNDVITKKPAHRICPVSKHTCPLQSFKSFSSSRSSTVFVPTGLLSCVTSTNAN